MHNSIQVQNERQIGERNLSSGKAEMIIVKKYCPSEF